MKYAIVEIYCHNSAYSDRVFATAEVMCTFKSREEAEEDKKLFEARDGHQYVVCQVQE